MSKAAIANIVAEKAVLGGLMRSPAAFWGIGDTLRADHFSNTVHQQIFGAIRDICTENKRLSVTLLSARLPEEDADGKSLAAYLAVLLANSEASGSPTDYADAVVESWVRRRLIEIAGEIQKQAQGDRPVIDVLSDLEVKIRDVTVGSEAQPEQSIGALLERAINAASEAFRDEEFVPGIDTGLPSLDEIAGRLMPGDFWVVGAFQGDGKTSLLSQIAERAGESGPALIFELEMQGEDMARRALAGESGLSVSEIEEGNFDFGAFERLKDAQAKLSKRQIFIDDRPRLKLAQIRARALAMKRSRGLALIGVDHMRLVQPDSKVRDAFERMEYVTGGLKSLAKEAQVPVIGLAQRTRTSQGRDDPRPWISDLWGGGSIEQDADGVLLLWRRENWLRQRKPRDSDGEAIAKWADEVRKVEGTIEAVCAKRRRGAAMGERRFRWNGKATRIEEL